MLPPAAHAAAVIVLIDLLNSSVAADIAVEYPPDIIHSELVPEVAGAPSYLAVPKVAGLVVQLVPS